MTKKLTKLMLTIATTAYVGIGTAYADADCLDNAKTLKGYAEDLRVAAGQKGMDSEVSYIDEDIIDGLSKVIRKKDEEKCNNLYKSIYCERYQQSYKDVYGNNQPSTPPYACPGVSSSQN